MLPELERYALEPDSAPRRPPGSCTPSANSSIILRLNAGMSSGLRDVTRPRSTMTSWSDHVAPAFARSVFSDGHDVIRRPLTAPASMSVHGPWQMAAIGLF